ncbi:uncharacterized protein LACBIDRAFT_326677 [Laccaria bicolor S238N-H82]|uniref:Predicted protein n=1 Tax=Laccaria bicolor (strain S238N-H82 / ATCC MYA-4686) TaxID=486041 RepID=B0D838_LACBS|nr:uncharacterized protein LACBIDRAFT_326677 [Laccaria bicolor S238N-H82]EDR09244.1 predicted protein [Laccaria bicolor S238N-H82]|eukprot:XP_001880557.1 predicted protein [Laccaria bicolor S238N-H82]
MTETELHLIETQAINVVTRIFEMRQLATGPTPNWGNCYRKKDRTMVRFSSVHRFFAVLWTEPLNASPAPTGTHRGPTPFSPDRPTDSKDLGAHPPPLASLSLPPVNSPAPTGTHGGPVPYSLPPTGSSAPIDPKSQGAHPPLPASSSLPPVNGPAPTGAQGGPAPYSSPFTNGPAPNDTKQSSPAPGAGDHMSAPPAGRPSSSLPHVHPALSNAPASPASTNSPVAPAPNAGPAAPSVASTAPLANNTPSKSPAGSAGKESGVPKEECTSTLPPKNPAPAVTLEYTMFELFAGPVYRTENIHRTELD